jgi:hypothetical protein
MNSDSAELTARDSTSCHHLNLALSLLLFALYLIFLVNGKLALGKISLNFLQGSNIFLGYPRVSDDVGHGGASSGIKLKHGSDEIAELLREKFQ